MLGADGFAEQDGSRGPFAAESQTQERPYDKKLAVALRESGKKGENSKPQDGDLKHPHTPETIGEPSCKPSTDCGRYERNGCQPAGVGPCDAPGCNQGGDNQGVDLEIHRVERPPPNARAEGAAFLFGEIADPADDAVLCIDRRFQGFHSAGILAKIR